MENVMEQEVEVVVSRIKLNRVNHEFMHKDVDTFTILTDHESPEEITEIEGQIVPDGMVQKVEFIEKKSVANLYNGMAKGQEFKNPGSLNRVVFKRLGVVNAIS